MSLTHFQQAIAWMAERLCNGVPEGIVVALLTWFSLRIVGGKNSSTRFAVWGLAFLTIVVLPLAGGWTASYSASHRSLSSVIAVPISWAKHLVLVWMAIAAVGLSRVAVGLWNLRTLRADHTAIDPRSLPPELERTLREFEPWRRVSVGVSRRLSVPAAIGFFQPMILLPAWTLSELSPEELNSILIHELAHLRRWDDWTNLGQRIIRALLFFHPAIWWIDRQLSLQREMACDDHVLSRIENPRSYAECLVTVAEKSLFRRGLGLAQAAVRGMRQTSRRVAEILAANHPRTVRVWKPVVGFVAAFSALGVMWLARAPELVVVRDPMAVAAVARPLSSTTARAPENAVLAKFEGGGSWEGRTHASAVPPRNLPQPDGFEVRAVPRRFKAQLRPAATLAASQMPMETVVVVTRTESQAGPRWTVCVWRISLVTSDSGGPQSARPFDWRVRI
ncbi:MAG TPA: M56 family metallopeptidase [Terriglobales bacterium]|nr:M56 family metallopeptidase [Terriglobales bacterium]